MIVGIGVDVIEVQRIADIMENHGPQFLDRVFNDQEKEGAPCSNFAAARHYAGRWSAKEAVAKALGTGVGEFCGWRDINVTNCYSGRPVVTISGRGRETADRLGVTNIHVTISHEKGLACASAVIEGDDAKRQENNTIEAKLNYA